MRREIFKVDTFVLLIVSVFVMIFLTQAVALARSGCCSHHGGVCGCGCCDGKALSATCVPYYPSCKVKYLPPKNTRNIKNETEVKYNNLVVEKNKIVKERDVLVKEEDDLKKEIEDLKNKINKVKKENQEKNEKISKLEKGTKESGILDEINQTKTEIVKPKKQTKNNKKEETFKNDDEDNSDGGGFASFLFGGGFVYGINRLKRRQELKKEGVYIKGNITNDGQKIYYTPDSRYYNMVKIDKKNGERWFISEEEARVSGWEKA